MKHTANAFHKKLGRAFRSIFPLLIVILLCILLFGCTNLIVLEKMDHIASLVLKFSIAFFFFALTQYLLCSTGNKKSKVNKTALKRKKKNNITRHISPSTKKEQRNTGEICSKEVEFSSQEAADNVSFAQCATQAILDQSTQPEVKDLISSIAFFGPFDDSEMIAELEGEPRTTYLKIYGKGELVGYKQQNGVYQIFPRVACPSEQDIGCPPLIPQVVYLTEQDVKYSPLPICFVIDEVIPVKKMNKVEIAQSATLIESEKKPGLYTVHQKGKLNIIS